MAIKDKKKMIKKIANFTNASYVCLMQSLTEKSHETCVFFNVDKNLSFFQDLV